MCYSIYCHSFTMAKRTHAEMIKDSIELNNELNVITKKQRTLNMEIAQTPEEIARRKAILEKVNNDEFQARRAGLLAVLPKVITDELILSQCALGALLHIKVKTKTVNITRLTLADVVTIRVKFEKYDTEVTFFKDSDTMFPSKIMWDFFNNDENFSDNPWQLALDINDNRVAQSLLALLVWGCKSLYKAGLTLNESGSLVTNTENLRKIMARIYPPRV